MSNQKKILITCTNLIATIDDFEQLLAAHQIEFDIPEVKQHLSEEQLLDIIANYDGWIAGDDPATRAVLEKGKSGKLRALVKWGIGVDSIDQQACKDLGIKFSNTPGMFGEEVADSALSYLLCMCRQTHEIDRQVRSGKWYKPLGITLNGKKALVIGYGNIGKAIVRRLKAFGVICYVKDPMYRQEPIHYGASKDWIDQWRGRTPINVQNLTGLPEYDFVILSCPLIPETHHMVNDMFLKAMKNTAILVNVARGPVVDTSAIVRALERKEIAGYATDVFETEPLPINSDLRGFNNTMFGSHNSSNTKEGVERTNKKAIQLIADFLS